MPVRLIGDAVELKSSMKSFVYVEPAFPPPPYNWEITSPD
jgi:hypothetical protein